MKQVNSRTNKVRSLFFAMASLTIAGSVWAAPNTGSGGTKTASECKADHGKCVKGCDGLIDVGTQVKDCKGKCQDTMVLCARVASTGGVRGQVGGANSSGTSTSPGASRSTTMGLGGKVQTK